MSDAPAHPLPSDPQQDLLLRGSTSEGQNRGFVVAKFDEVM